MNITVGCCGFGMAREKYFRQFNTVEVQDTFYEPPKIATLNKWKEDAPDEFEFALKAWQLITHESKSPTYRRLKRTLTASERTECGAFRSSSIVLEAWSVTLECVSALEAKSVLFQCPGSFLPTKDNIGNMQRFFSEISRPPGVRLFWEPRGAAWTETLVRKMCKQLDIDHAVDPFVSSSVTPKNIYYRLHGQSGWRYQYSDEELRQIADKLGRAKNAHVYFNNMTMNKDASRFLGLISEEQ